MARTKRKRSFEDMMQELEQHIERIENEGLELAEMLEEYQAGMSLVMECKERLNAAQAVLQPEPEPALPAEPPAEEE